MAVGCCGCREASLSFLEISLPIACAKVYSGPSRWATHIQCKELGHKSTYDNAWLDSDQCHTIFSLSSARSIFLSLLDLMTFPRNSLRAFLQYAKTNLAQAINGNQKVNIVIGNESAGALPRLHIDFAQR